MAYFGLSPVRLWKLKETAFARDLRAHDITVSLGIGAKIGGSGPLFYNIQILSNLKIGLYVHVQPLCSSLLCCL